MRIIGGALGGRVFEAPRGHRTHPMGDRVRGALFNALGDIEGLTVLDAFAGSGALAYEALSRGARRAILVELDASAQRAISVNTRQLDLSKQARLIAASAGAWLSTDAAASFDIVLCDPPYDQLQLPLVQQLALRCKSGGIVVLSYPGKQAAPELEGCQLVKQNNYGDAQLLFYERLP